MAMGIVLPVAVGSSGFYLRDMILEDAAAFQGIHEDMKKIGQYYAALRKYEKIRPDGSADASEVGLNFVGRGVEAQGKNPRDTYALALCDPAERVVGYTVALMNSNSDNDPRLNDGVEIGYFVSPGSQGRHLATLSTAVLTMAALADRGLDLFWGKVHSANAQSVRVFEKLGMRLIDVTKAAYDLQAPDRLLYTGSRRELENSEAFRILRKSGS